VLRDRGPAHGQVAGDLPDRERPAAEQLEHGAPGRVRKRGETVLVSAHLHKYQLTHSARQGKSGRTREPSAAMRYRCDVVESPPARANTIVRPFGDHEGFSPSARTCF
jgi:hypothetical protein